MYDSTGDPWPSGWWYGDPYWTAPYRWEPVIRKPIEYTPEPPRVSIDFDFAKPKQEGWVCPQCGSVFAPQVSECYHCAMSKKSESGGTNDPPDEDE